MQTELMRKLKKETAYQKDNSGIVQLDVKECGSVAYSMWKAECKAPFLSVKLMPYYYGGVESEEAKKRLLIPQKDYGVVYDAVESAFLGPNHIALQREAKGQALHQVPRDVAFEAMELVCRSADVEKGTAIVYVAVMYENCAVTLLLKRAI
jgi:hypothetical protein